MRQLKYMSVFKYCAVFIVMGFCNTSKGQDASQQKNVFSKLNTKGISFGISGALEGYNNFDGGIKTGTAYATTFDANINVDLQKLIVVQNATFYADLEYHAGDNPTKKLIGDFQVFDKHNSFPFVQIFEFWYQQTLFNSKLRIKIGKIDANSEFSLIDNGLEFINSSTQVTPTFFVFPTFPDAAPGINVFYSPNKLVNLNLAMDYANRKAGFLEFYGDPLSMQPTTNGVLLLSEMGLSWSRLHYLKKDGNFKLGLWHHTGAFSSFKDESRRGANGIYAIVSQTLWQPFADSKNQRGLRMFLEFGLADPNLTAAFAYYGGGIVWIGLSPKREEDVIGFSTQYVSLSPELQVPKPNETNLEIFYKLSLSNWLNVKADVKYIINPGGQFNNALVGIMVLNFKFGS
ncbi:MAG: carbohydrate porin [Gelidibacter sp.]